MTPPNQQQPTVNPRHFLVMAMVFGTLLVAAVLLWVLEVISLGVFIGAVAVIAVAQALVVLRIVRGARRRADDGGRTPGGTSTIGPDSPAARYGYDPTDDLRRP